MNMPYLSFPLFPLPGPGGAMLAKKPWGESGGGLQVHTVGNSNSPEVYKEESVECGFFFRVLEIHLKPRPTSYISPTGFMHLTKLVGRQGLRQQAVVVETNTLVFPPSDDGHVLRWSRRPRGLHIFSLVPLVPLLKWRTTTPREGCDLLYSHNQYPVM